MTTLLVRIAAAVAWLVILAAYLTVSVVGLPVALAVWASEKLGRA